MIVIYVVYTFFKNLLEELDDVSHRLDKNLCKVTIHDSSVFPIATGFQVLIVAEN